MRRNSPTAVVILAFLFLGLFGNLPAWTDLNSGDTLGQANWQEAKGRMPDPVLRRFQDSSYQAKVIALPASLSWGSKFKAASAANAGKFSVDANGALIDNTTHTYPAFLYGDPFPQIDSKDPQAAAKVMYNFSYTLMQADDADRFSNLHRVTPSALDHYIEFQGQILFYGSRFSGPIANPDATLRKLIIAGVAPYEVVGVVTLEWVYLDPGQWNSLWTFIPALKRVRRLNAANGSDSLFGLDLAHDDPYRFSGKVQKEGWKGKAWWPTNYSLVKRPVWVVEATAKDAQYAYSRQVLWIDRELYVGYYKEAYDKDGRLWRMLLNSVSLGQTAQGDFSVAQPDFTLSVDEQRNYATVELPLKQGQQLSFGVGLPEEIFTQSELMKRGK